MTFEKKLQEYAELIIRRGLAVKEGQLVLINLPASLYEFAELLVEDAYKQGASEVRVDFNHQPLTRLGYDYRSVENLSDVKAWEIAKLEEQIEKKPARLYITGEDPDGLAGVDQDKLQASRQARYPILKPYNDKLENQYAWCIAGAATKPWAKKVFPDLPEDEAERKLWDAIFDACRVGDGKAIDRWDEHNKTFEARSRWLNEQGFDYLHYTSPEGTDCKVWLNPKVKWDGGDEALANGHRFNPNLPTEEIFTTPVAGKAEGKLCATMPLSSNGQLIDQFWIEFSDGKAVRWDAKTGKDALTSIITMDEGSSRLGELALVPDESPISQAGILFYNTLFDENASCHVALGRGFSNLLEDFEGLDSEALQEAGINQSMMHVDFMVGSPRLNIDGVLPNGETVAIFRDGNWAFEI